MAEAEIKSVACKCGNFSFTFPVPAPQVAPDHKVEAECPSCGAVVTIHGPGKKGGNS